MKSFENTILENLGKVINDNMGSDSVVDLQSQGIQDLFESIRLKRMVDNFDLTNVLDECRELIRNKAYNKDEKVNLAEKKIEDCFENSVSIKHLVMEEMKKVKAFKRRREFHREVSESYMSGLPDTKHAAPLNEAKLSNLLGSIMMNKYDQIFYKKTTELFEKQIPIVGDVLKDVYTLSDFEYCLKAVTEKLFI